MSRVYAECNIVISPVLEAKPLRKKTAEVNMEIFSSQSAGGQKPITLIIKGQNFARVMELMTLYHKLDSEIAKAVGGSVLASEVPRTKTWRRWVPGLLRRLLGIAALTDEEVAAWARGNIVTELEEMA